jgi:hypothetical protein
MSYATLVRLSGASLVLGGLTHLVYLFTHPHSSGLAYYADPATALSHLAGFASVVLILLGLPGLHARQAERAGILGLVGIVLVCFGLAMVDGTHTIIDSAFTPALATIPEAAPLLASGGPLEEAMLGGMQGTLVSAGGPMLLLGLILLGASTVRAGVLPRWAGALPIFAALSVPLGFVAPSLEGVAFAMPYLALGCLGSILTVGEGASAGTQAAEPVPAVR